MLCGLGPLGVGGRNNTVAHFAAGLSLSRGERLLAYGGFPQISQIAQIWIPIQSLKVVHADFVDDADFTELNLRGPGFYRVCTPFLKKNWLSVEGRMNSCYFCIVCKNFKI